MSKEIELRRTATVRHIGSEKTTEVRGLVFPDDPAPRGRAEVVSDEDKRFEQALERKAKSPTDFIKEASRVQPPLSKKGALVSVETFLGFLAALETILPPDATYPLLTSAKVWFDPSDHPKLFLEGGSHSVWTIVAIDAEARTKKGFTTLLPVRRAKNVLRATSTAQRTLMVGVDHKGICLGSHAVPFGGKLEDFPSQPVMVDPIARAAMPAFYYQDIVERVMPARSKKDFGEAGSQGVLLDFEIHDVDGRPTLVAVAVASDGDRLHILNLPRMVLDPNATKIPPAILVYAGFFRYMKAIVNHEWAGMEFSSDHLVAKGKDFIVITKVRIERKDKPSNLGNWRKINVGHKGCWMVDTVLLEKAIQGVPGKTFQLKLDTMYDRLTVSGEDQDGTRYLEQISARNCDGAPYVAVEMNKKYMLDAIKACATKLVRLGFDHKRKTQPSSPVVVKGEDEQFKAIVMPIAGGPDA